MIQPKASKTEVVGPHGEPPRLKIRIAAPPVEGAANEELVRCLAKRLGISKSSVVILRGDSSRRKDVACSNIEVADAVARLLD